MPLLTNIRGGYSPLNQLFPSPSLIQYTVYILILNTVYSIQYTVYILVYCFCHKFKYHYSQSTIYINITLKCKSVYLFAHTVDVNKVKDNSGSFDV